MKRWLIMLLAVFAVTLTSLCSAAPAKTPAKISTPAKQNMTLEQFAAGKTSILFIGPLTYIEPGLVRELTAKGYIVQASDWPGLNIDRLRQFNTVVISSWGSPPDFFQDKYMEILDEYLKLGGGIITFLNEWEGHGVKVRPWFEKYGLEVVHETILDPTNEKDVPRPKYLYGAKVTLTKGIHHPHPVTEGVRSLWYLTGFNGYGKSNAIPLVVDKNWSVLISSESTSKIIHWGEAILPNYRPEMQDKQGSWPMVAARRIGNGRIVVAGMCPMIYVWAPHFDKWDEVGYRKGVGGVPSDFHIMFDNALRWTAEPTLKSGTMGFYAGLFPPKSQGDTAPTDWTTKEFANPGPWLYGVLGAHTSYSTGKGTVADWAAAAKAEGLSFVVFLEDMRKMDAKKWAQLKADCKAASSGDVRCYPGMEYLMQVSAGGEHTGTNHGFVLDGRQTMPWLLDRQLTKDNDVNVADDEYKAAWDLHFGTNLGNGFMEHEKNSIPYWDYKMYALFSVLSQKDGKKLDDMIPQYLEGIEGNLNLVPMGISMQYDPAELKGIRKDGRPLLVVNGAHDDRYPQLKAGLQQVDVHVGCQGEEWNLGLGMYRGWYGPTVTEGPAVSLRYRAGYTWKRVEQPRYWIERYASVQHEDWFMPSYARIPIRLDAASDNPIREVVVYNGPKVLYRFDARGAKTFTTEFTIAHDQNRHIVAYVVDSQGRRAVTPEIWTEQQQHPYNFCGDRMNAPMNRGASPGHGHCFYEGMVSMGSHRQILMGLYPRALPGLGLESRRFGLDLVCPDIYLERATSDRYYPKANKYWSAWTNYTGSIPRDDLRLGTLRYEWYQGHGRKYVHWGETGIIWDGYPYGPGDDTPKYAYYASQRNWGETKKELKPMAGTGFVPGLTQIVWDGDITQEAPVKYTVYTPAGITGTGQLFGLKGDRTSGPLPDGSAIVLDSGFTVRVHGTGLGYAFFTYQNGAYLRIGPISDGPVPAGTRYDWWYENIDLALADPLKMDIAWLTVKQGTLLEHFVGATLQAKGHVAQVVIGKQPLKVNSTPLEVRGINSNWTCGYFEPKGNQYRPLGNVNGVAYAQFDASRTNVEAVIGNVVTCNQPEVRIVAVQETDADGKATGVWNVEAHNPTRQALQTEFAVPAAFSLIKQRNYSTMLPAETTVKFTLR